MRKRILSLALVAVCCAGMSGCGSRVLVASEDDGASTVPQTSSREAGALLQDGEVSESAAAATAVVPSAPEAPVSDDDAAAPPAPAAVNPAAQTVQSSEDLEKMAQCVLVGGFAAENNDPTRVDPDLLQSMLYQLYTFRTAQDFRYSDGSAEQTGLVDIGARDFVPVVQDAIDAARRIEDHGIWFSIPSVYEVYRAVVDCALSEEEFSAQAIAAVASEYIEVMDGGLVYPMSESFYGAVYYADPVPFPHQDNNTYLFRLTCFTAGGWHTLFDVTFTPAPDSPFGCRVLSSVDETGGLGEELVELARDFSVHPDGFVFPDSDSRILTQMDRDRLYNELGVETWNEQYVLAFARNELFARHGNIFDTPAYSEFFSHFDWYAPTHKVETSEFNETERINLDTIIAWENEAKAY